MKKLTYLIIYLVLNGCATQSYFVNSGLSEDKPSLDSKQTFFVGGIGQEDNVDAAKICNGVENIIKVESELTFTDGLLNILTSGIYTPRTARVYCKKIDAA